jgi:hypothetical protein
MQLLGSWQGGCAVGGALCQLRHHGACGDGKRQHARRASSERSNTVGELGLFFIPGMSRLDAMGLS